MRNAMCCGGGLCGVPPPPPLWGPLYRGLGEGVVYMWRWCTARGGVGFVRWGERGGVSVLLCFGVGVRWRVGGV